MDDSPSQFRPDLDLANRDRRIATRQLVLVNDAMATMKFVSGSKVSREELIRHTLGQIASLVGTHLAELWTYDWNTMTAVPSAVQADRHFYGSVPALHPARNGIPIPQSLVHANRRVRRRSRTFVSTFDEQPDVAPWLFEYYRGICPCDRFIHFPLVEGEHVVAAVVALIASNESPDSSTMELAHALGNRLMANLSTMELTSQEVRKKNAADRKKFRSSIKAVEAQRDLLSRMSANLSNGSGMISFVQEVLREACLQLDASYGYVSRYDETQDSHQKVFVSKPLWNQELTDGEADPSWSCQIEESDHVYHASECPMWETLATTLKPTSVRVAEVDGSRFGTWKDFHQRRGHTVVTAAPMLMVHHAIGSLSLASTSESFGQTTTIAIQHALAQHAAMAIRLSELSKETHAVAVRGERTRIARDIHDNLAQFFTGIVAQSDAALESIRLKKGGVDDYLTRISQMARDGIKQARRTVDVLSLVESDAGTLQTIILGTLRRFCEGTNIHYQVDLCQNPPGYVDSTLREVQSIVTEAISNVVKHSGATTVSVVTQMSPSAFSVCLSDDGHGFDSPETEDGHIGHGLENMRHRASLIGAKLNLSSQKGAGTQIELLLPIPE